jgi:hypothetical protein
MLVTQRRAGYNGILWDLMGTVWKNADFSGFLAPVSGHFGAGFGVGNPVDKLVNRESPEDCKLGHHGVEIV